MTMGIPTGVLQATQPGAKDERVQGPAVHGGAGAGVQGRGDRNTADTVG